MTSQERNYFNRLIDTRQKFYDQVQEAEKVGTVEGFWDSVVEKYSDRVHFIYEVLQNADDALAKNAHFELFDDCLVFRHDGKRRFTISDPDTYKQDRADNKVGDINGITSIGASGKFFDNAKIGKFGLGFKAVFQYTLTPQIYDDNAFFEIHDYIVPRMLSNDYPGRKPNETVFVFPFNNHEGISKENAVEDIKKKLSNLVYPNLFLNSLEKITYDCFGERGVFRKQILTEIEFDDVVAQKITVTKGSKKNTDSMWLFSRTDEEGYKFSVGFLLDENGIVTVPERQYPAFCFFPTIVTTNLNFIIHAPFLLNETREGIPVGDHNENMIQGLAELAADSIECLCRISEKSKKPVVSDDIIDVLPFQENLYYSDDDKISFMPFFCEIRDRMQTARVLPIRKGFTTMDMAYWADTEDIPKLISDAQLSELLEGEAHFVFVSKGANSTRHNAASGKGKYIDSIVSDSIVEDDLYNTITPEFIEGQKEAWLIKLYRYILEGRNRATRISKVRKLPIFLDEAGKAIAAYKENDHANLFLPDDETSGYSTINENLYKNAHTKKILDELGIKTPEQEDKIFNKIIPQYGTDGIKKSGSTRKDFRVFLKYYIDCDSSDKQEDLVSQIKDLCFIEAVSSDGEEKWIAKPEQVYMPTEELKKYFSDMKDIMFVDLGEYEGFIGKRDWRFIEEFLEAVGVEKHVRRYWEEYSQDDYEIVKELYGDSWPEFTWAKRNLRRWKDARLLGGEQMVSRIIETQSKELSKILWKELAALFARTPYSWKDKVLGGVHNCFYYGNNTYTFNGLDESLFRESAWVVNRDGEFVEPEGLILQDISPIYDVDDDGVSKLVEYLGMLETDPQYENLSDDQIKKLQFMELLRRTGLPSDVTEDEVGYMVSALLRQRNSGGEVSDEPTGDIDESKTGVRVAREIEKRIATRKDEKKDKKIDRTTESKDDEDSDELTKAVVHYDVKIENTKKKWEEEIRRLEELEDAQNRAITSGEYTYGWFCGLLELEAAANGEDNMSSREVSISFSKVEPDEESNKALILKQPNKNIPQVLEELVDIPLVLNVPDKQPIKLVIEGITIQSYTVKVKIKNPETLEGIDYEAVSEARIDAQNPSFLLRELQKQFLQLGFDDDYDMQGNLCENIKFVFGPPGTGKTTYLSNEVIIPIVKEAQNQRILVLAPTNKAADVIVERIMETMGNDHSYENWLIRYGVTINEKIENSNVFHGKETDINDYDNCVLVTTIARFPYDYLISNDKKRHYLYGLNWDYVIIDEASMIPLIQVVLPLYLKTPKQFIIAGDPFQIQPTFSVDAWKDQNIYSMVRLDSFTSPRMVPHNYEVELLTTQYRSVPDVGRIFSELTYGGVLEHARLASSRRELNIDKYIDYDTLNIIKFPVSKYESIKKAKQLKRSNYHIYSALFTYEFVCYLAKALAKENPGEIFRIGIIAPYTAQAGLIDKLVVGADLPPEIKVSCGTIHGFQGDECDIVLAVFNPPPSISDSKKIFLNRQNIVNVAISRARDYLFVIMPDDDTDRVNDLKLIKRVESLIKESSNYVETKSKWIENRMFNDPQYLEDHSFATGHQLVNVYGIPEQRYEIRSEESAIDIQIHNEV